MGPVFASVLDVDTQKDLLQDEASQLRLPVSGPKKVTVVPPFRFETGPETPAVAATIAAHPAVAAAVAARPSQLRM